MSTDISSSYGTYLPQQQNDTWDLNSPYAQGSGSSASAQYGVAQSGYDSIALSTSGTAGSQLVGQAGTAALTNQSYYSNRIVEALIMVVLELVASVQQLVAGLLSKTGSQSASSTAADGNSTTTGTGGQTGSTNQTNQTNQTPSTTGDANKTTTGTTSKTKDKTATEISALSKQFKTFSTEIKKMMKTMRKTINGSAKLIKQFMTKTGALFEKLSAQFAAINKKK